MKFSYKIQLCCFIINTIIGIRLVWMLLEYLIYGEVQPQVVDDIINILYVVAVFKAYKLGRSHEKDFYKTYHHIENWWTNPPTYFSNFNDTLYNKKGNDKTGGDNYY